MYSSVIARGIPYQQLGDIQKFAVPLFPPPAHLG